MLAKLLEHTGPAERREIAIHKDDFLLGRGSDCDLRLSGTAISRHHCLIRIRGGEATLGDLGSANGTFVNGQRVRSQATLQHGDLIAVGDFHFTFAMTGGSGLNWGTDTANDPLAVTRRIKDVKSIIGAKNEESHPPGEAGG